ncbi:MAG: hypothetical protein IPH74_11120 [Bacteroidetes bacterium]|nr:hypothetical protein [Bacteroidota bacterium]
MLKYFEISFRDKETLNNKENNLKGMLVGLNLTLRLKKLKYIKNQRINLEFSDTNTEIEEELKSNDTNQISKDNSLYKLYNRSVCNIYAGLTKDKQNKLFSNENYLKDLLFISIIQLKKIWNFQGWSEGDLDLIQKEIIEADLNFQLSY